jgi:hypothetical protein
MLFQAVEVEYLKSDLVPMFLNLAKGQIVQGLIVPRAFSGCGGGVPQVGPGPDVREPCSGRAGE